MEFSTRKRFRRNLTSEPINFLYMIVSMIKPYCRTFPVSVIFFTTLESRSAAEMGPNKPCYWKGWWVKISNSESPVHVSVTSLARTILEKQPSRSPKSHFQRRRSASPRSTNVVLSFALVSVRFQWSIAPYKGCLGLWSPIITLWVEKFEDWQANFGQRPHLVCNCVGSFLTWFFTEPVSAQNTVKSLHHVGNSDYARKNPQTVTPRSSYGSATKPPSAG